MNVGTAISVPFLAILFLAAPVFAQEETDEDRWAKFIESIDWVRGPAAGEMPPHATVELPEGYVFTGVGHTQRIMTYFGNTLTDTEVGFVAPVSFLSAENVGPQWCMVFEFKDLGYVKDAGEEEIDADALMESLQESQEENNKERQRLGYDTLTVLGWAKPPYYDPETKNLEWATRLQSGDGSLNVNHNIRYLGRRGVMEVTLITGPETLDTDLAEAKKVLAAFGFQSGQTYGDYQPGDKVWKWGLAGLIVGGGAAAALKTGFFAKIWKVLWKLLLVIGVGIAAVYRRIVGGPKRKDYGEHRRRRSASDDEAPPEA